MQCIDGKLWELPILSPGNDSCIYSIFDNRIQQQLLFICWNNKCSSYLKISVLFSKIPYQHVTLGLHLRLPTILFKHVYSYLFA